MIDTEKVKSMASRSNTEESAIIPPADALAVASDVEKSAAAADAAAAEAAHPLAGLFVQYTGPQKLQAAKEALKKRNPILGEGTTAQITPKHWADAGIASTVTFTWNLSNKWQIPASRFTQQQLEHLLFVSNRFEIVNAEGEKATL